MRSLLLKSLLFFQLLLVDVLAHSSSHQDAASSDIFTNGFDFGVMKKAVSLYHNQAQLWVGDRKHLVFPNTRVYEGEHFSLSILRNGTADGVFVHGATVYEFAAQARDQRSGDSLTSLPKIESFVARRLKGTTVGGCKTKDVGAPLPHERRLLKGSEDGGSRRELEGVKRWTDCYRDEETTRYLDIGIVADCSFYQLHESSLDVVLHTIESFVSRTNLIFSKQLNVRLRVKQILVLPCDGPDSTLPFNLCRHSIEQDLVSFSAWAGSLKFGGDQQEQIVQQGLWHLLTACHGSPGTIGIAYLQQTNDASRFGTVCEHALNVGVTSVKSGTPWLTFAHEIGHNLGARHSVENGKGTTGGIMDTGSSGVYDGDIQFNPYRKTEICHELDYSIHSGVCEYIVEDEVHNFYTAFHADCKNISSTASCGSSESGRVCEHGLCVTPKFDLRLSGVSAVSKPINRIEFDKTLSSELLLALDPGACKLAEHSGASSPFLLVDLLQVCKTLDVCAIAKDVGAAGIIATELTCSSAGRSDSSMRDMFSSCSSIPVVYIDPHIGCQLREKLLANEHTSVELVESPSTAIIANLEESGPSSPEQWDTLAYPGIVSTIVVVSFVLFGVIVVWFKSYATESSTKQVSHVVI